jgi:uncharacterized membrane protein YeaQ/YmgE (transglycosylase-associated protein family)
MLAVPARRLRAGDPRGRRGLDSELQRTGRAHVTLTFIPTIMDLLTWLIVGLIAGVLASLVMGGGYGLIGDIVIGVVGAFIGGWIFRRLGVTSPFGGLAGTIFVAFIGAVVLLFLLRLLHRRGRPL